MKKISIVIPTYNEQDNVVLLSEALLRELSTSLAMYDYELIFIDNCSQDQTRVKLLGLCNTNKKIKAIFNAKNFGQFNSPYYGLLQSSGDCTILMCADFQDPPSMLLPFVKAWEDGYKIVIGIKSKSKESKIMYCLRSCYYRIIKKMSDTEQIEHFTGFGLYDQEFIQVLSSLNDPTPFLRGIVAELGFRRKEIEYTQENRLHGKTSNNFYRLYDAAMLSITSYTKVALRFATIIGFLGAAISLLIAVGYFILKVLYWDSFPMGTAPILIGIFLLGSIQIFFIGFLGEYILAMNIRVMNRPLVIEEKRINFEEGVHETMDNR